MPRACSLLIPLILCLAAAALPCGSSRSEPAKTAKKLIEFGWDEPDTGFMRRHVAEMEQSPFDGCVFHVTYPKPEGKPGNFTWECWGKRSFTEADLRPAEE